MGRFRHKVVNGICYLTKVEETHIERCKKHNPPKLNKKDFVKMNSQNLPILEDDKD